MARKRGRIPRSRSRKIFTNGAMRVHGKNFIDRVVMRGGIRL